jgi:uncharacterized membrane protein (DUF106 family)
MIWQFIKDLLYGIFLSLNSITTWIGFASLAFFFLPRLEGKVNKRVRKIKPYALYILSYSILISVIFTSYSMYTKKQQKIDELQEQIHVIEQKDNPKVTAPRIPHK